MAVTPFRRLEDAQRAAKESAAILATYFHARAREADEDDVALFTAMGLAHRALDILVQLDAMLVAAQALRDEAAQ
jgi:hypothetical protein